MIRLEPGQSYKYSGTLSWPRDVTVLYDNGALAEKMCVTGHLHKQNNEYRLSKLSKGVSLLANEFLGCWMDAAPESPQTNVVLGEEHTFQDRLFDVMKGHGMYKE